MFGLKPIKTLPIREKIAATLREAILSQKIPAGEVLTLESTAQELGVSITPVREAFQILARDGLLELKQNKRAVVVGVTEKTIQEHFQIRAALESEACVLCCKNKIDLKRIDQILKVSREVIEDNQIFNCRKINTDLLFYFHSLFQELDEKKEGYEEICRHTLSILIAQLRRITDSGFQLVPSFHPSKECAQIKRYLDSNYGEDINLDQLAALSHLNKYYLSHEFTRYYGISPINYLNRRRIEVCKNLLENTDHDISDIAHLAGFSSQSYLAQSFRKSCGMTAMEYRRSRRE